MKLRQFRYFLALAEEQHFGRAARRLHMTQPPLSMQIRLLEEELGVTLFIRSTRRVQLTDAGKTFADHARRVLAEVELAGQVSRQAEAGLYGRLEIGFVSSATLTVLPPALREFRRRFPDVELVLREVPSGQQIESVLEGAIRIGLARLPIVAPGLDVEPLLSEPLAAALPSEHPLASKHVLSLEMIADEPLVLFSRRDVPGLHDQIVSCFQAIDRTPRVAQRALYLQTIVGLVAGGLGLSILPGSCRHLSRDGVVYRPIEWAAPDSGRSWLGMLSQSNDASPLLQRFKAVLGSVAQRLDREDRFTRSA